MRLLWFLTFLLLLLVVAISDSSFVKWSRDSSVKLPKVSIAFHIGNIVTVKAIRVYLLSVRFLWLLTIRRPRLGHLLLAFWLFCNVLVVLFNYNILIKIISPFKGCRIFKSAIILIKKWTLSKAGLSFFFVVIILFASLFWIFNIWWSHFISVVEECMQECHSSAGIADCLPQEKGRINLVSLRCVVHVSRVQDVLVSVHLIEKYYCNNWLRNKVHPHLWIHGEDIIEPILLSGKAQLLCILGVQSRIAL